MKLKTRIFFIFLTVLISESSSQGISFPGSQPGPSLCQTQDNNLGVCKSLTECPEAISHGFNAKICGFNSLRPTVCCPMRTVPIKDGGVTAPRLSFRCGNQTASSGPVSSVPAFFRRRRSTIPKFVDSQPPKPFDEVPPVIGGFDSFFNSTWKTSWPWMHNHLKRSRRAFVVVGGTDAIQRDWPWMIGRQKRSGIPIVRGGSDAIENAWPWMALLGRGNPPLTPKWFCSASLINEKWLLTAAHCLAFGNPDIIRLGEHNYNITTDNKHTDYKLKKVVVYPKYKKGPNRLTDYHDLALLEVEGTVKLSRTEWPVCLPWSHDKIVKDKLLLTITGWGSKVAGGEPHAILQEAQVEVFPTSKCNSSYSDLLGASRKWPQGITPQLHICAGNSTGGVDTCQGDSGGPALQLDPSSRTYTAIGVVSQGNGCGLEAFPGLYVNLAKGEYLQWIKDVAFAN